MSLPSCPSFSDFYREVHGWDPFPWQQRLAEQVFESAQWPSEVGVATGLGKSSCLDVALWVLAAQADLSPAERSAPTRIWWVVNRRLLVDSTFEHAQHLKDLLADAVPESALGAVAARLRSLSSTGRTPIDVVRLRGGASFGRPSEPSQPAIVLATIPMFGSRWLFRGYGSSRSMRPVDAALAGTDSLVLVDEAHLARHLIKLAGPLADCDRAAAHPLRGQRVRPTIVSLTATGSAVGQDRFDLDANDRAHRVVAQRLSAAKRLTVSSTGNPKKPHAALAGALIDAFEMRPSLESGVVFCNTPKTARLVSDQLRSSKELADVEIVMLTGRMREREAKSVRDLILDPLTGVRSGNPRGKRPRPLVVVATQTLEVGADVDFECLVTEACGVRSLTQRLGRLNRLGQFASAHATYVHLPAKDDYWPVYGSEPAIVLERLKEALGPDLEAGSVDVSPATVSSCLGEPMDDPGYAPEILPGLLWEWAKTTTPPPGEADVEPYFSGLQMPTSHVSVCWRSHIPAHAERVWPYVKDTETVDIPIAELREALEAGTVLEDTSATRLTIDRSRVERVAISALRPGDTVLLPSDLGLYDEFGWNPDATGPVADLSILAAGVPVDSIALARLLPGESFEQAARLANELVNPEDSDGTDIANLVTSLRVVLSMSKPQVFTDDEWTSTTNALANVMTVVPEAVARIEIPPTNDVTMIDANDEMSLAAAVNLDAHGSAVANMARRIADALGVNNELAAAIEKAAEFHDLGKADERFQRWLDPGATSSSLVAKSTTPRHQWQSDRIASGWPSGGRHEELSRRLVDQWLLDTPLEPAGDVIKHLVVSHHGHGRPFLEPAMDDDTSAQVQSAINGSVQTVSADLTQPDWSQPKRFRELTTTHGFWGLALMEAIVRQADHIVSGGGAPLEVL